MSYQRSRKQKVVAKERRVQDRELARIERARRVRRAKERRIALRVSAVIAGLAVLTGAGLAGRAVVEAGRNGPANMAADGVVVSSDGTTTLVNHSSPLPDNGVPTPTGDFSSSGVTQLVVYVDYSDPASAAFWRTNGALMETWITSSQGMLTLELHPVAVKAARESFTPAPASSATPTPSGSATPAATATPTASATPTPASSATPTPSGTPTPTPTPNLQDAGYDYALRAANAFACVANGAPAQAPAVNDALFAAQGTFGTAGLSDDQLVDLVAKAGVTAKGTDKCIREHRYELWVTQATNRATLAVPFTDVKALTTAPLVVVGGHQYTGAVDDANAFLTLVMQAYNEATTKANAASATPSPTPEPSSSAAAGTLPTGTPTPAATTASTPTPTPSA